VFTELSPQEEWPFAEAADHRAGLVTDRLLKRLLQQLVVNFLRIVTEARPRIGGERREFRSDDRS
jgi:hypothetical protein